MIEVKKALEKGDLCDHCLGRLISLAFKGHPVEKVGAALRISESEDEIKNNLNKNLQIKESKDCIVCKGLFLKNDVVEELIIDKMKGQEFETFLIGNKLEQGVQDAEENLWSIVGCENCEPIKREINRYFGKSLEAKTGKKVDFDNPDVMFTVNYQMNRIETSISSVFIFGKYNKLIRGIPQTKWPCRECRGRGCKRCKQTGKMYEESVEELISVIAIPMMQATGAKFHGQGREDIDALMLGRGRPFVLEILNPKKRNVDLNELEKQVNKSDKVKITMLRFSDKKEVIKIKASESSKTYDCLIECKGVSKEDVEKINCFFQNIELQQNTPKRVIHRRADLLRKRKVISTEAELIDSNHFKARIKTQSGTYVKELISGDEGRTKPSFSELISKPCRCETLDVVEID